MELWCGTPKGLRHMAEAKPHQDEAGKAMDKMHDVSAEYQLTVQELIPKYNECVAAAIQQDD